MKKQLLAVVALVSMLFLNLHAAFAQDATKAPTDPGTTQVKSYTKKDGRVVTGCSRKKKGADTATAADTQQLKRYTKANCTKVAGYTRKQLNQASSL